MDDDGLRMKDPAYQRDVKRCEKLMDEEDRRRHTEYHVRKRIDELEAQQCLQ